MEKFILGGKKDAELLICSVEMFTTDQLPAFERSTINCVRCTLHNQTEDAKTNQTNEKRNNE